MCPFIEKDDPRCATHLTLSRLQQALSHCADAYETCPVYRQLAEHNASCRGTYEGTYETVRQVLAG